jgi:lipoprotein-anchoring transpeptidase ErfK/SrfK
VIASRKFARTAVALVAVVIMLMGAVSPALAEDVLAPPVPTIASGVTVCGIDVSGMTAEQAGAALASGFAMPPLAPLTLDATGTLFVFDPTPAVSLDVDGLVAEALAATAPCAIGARYIVDEASLTDFVASVATSIAVTPVGSKRTVVNRRLRITPSKVGRKLDTTATVVAVRAALDAELAAGGAEQPTVIATVIARYPRYTEANIGKTLLVVLSKRYVYYYSGTKFVTKYRCAIGMPGHSTPTGKFKVIRKSARPSWYNPGSAWARTMPRYIGPGYYNPLGLRALYINSPGIRIHGTSKTWSMGQAASHGCVRLTNANIVRLYPRIPVGTPVWIVK